MASATTYSIISGTNLVVSVLNQADEPLINLADAAPAQFANGPDGSRKLMMFLAGFSNANADDANIRVRMKMPEPIVLDGSAAPTPKFGASTPLCLISPGDNNNAAYYTARPVTFHSFSDPVAGPNVTLEEIDISVDVSPQGGTPFGVMLLVDFGWSASR